MTNSRAFKGATAVSLADQTVNNSETYVNSTSLKETVKANKNYGFQIILWVNSSATPDIKIKFTAPSGATAILNNLAQSLTPQAKIDALADIALTTDGNDQVISSVGRLIMSTTAGQFQLQFAQNNATVADTKLLEGSTLILWESS